MNKNLFDYDIAYSRVSVWHTASEGRCLGAKGALRGVAGRAAFPLRLSGPSR